MIVSKITKRTVLITTTWTNITMEQSQVIDKEGNRHFLVANKMFNTYVVRVELDIPFQTKVRPQQSKYSVVHEFCTSHSSLLYC